MSVVRFPSSPLGLSLTIGALGGIALLAVAATSRRGEDVYVPYAALVVGLAAAMWRLRDLPRADRVVLFLVGFALASLILYLGLVLVLSPSALGLSLWGHAWRLGFIASIGAGLGVIVAGLTGPGRRTGTRS